MKLISGFFYRIFKGWVALLSLLVLILFAAISLPAENARVAEYSHGLGSPDTHFFYSRSTLLQMAEVYGESGRATYIQTRQRMDLAFPFVYSFFFVAVISYLFKGTPGQQRFPLANLVPLAGLIFDLLENLAVSSVLSVYPLHDGWGLSVTPFFTLLKWFFFFGNLLLVITGLLLRVTSRRKTAST